MHRATHLEGWARRVSVRSHGADSEIHGVSPFAREEAKATKGFDERCRQRCKCDDGAPRETRTPSPWIRSPMLYPIELWARHGVS